MVCLRLYIFFVSRGKDTYFIRNNQQFDEIIVKMTELIDVLKKIERKQKTTN